MDSEAIFSEVVDVSQMAVLQVISKIANNSLTLIFNVVNSPKRPSFSVKSFPSFLEDFKFIRGIAELSLPIINVEGRFRE